MADRGDPGLPIKLGPCSNGEYPPRPPTPLAREAARRARRWSDERARRLGMSRRDFLLSAMGAATGLLALAACSKDESGGRSGGTFEVPEDATTDPDVATTVLGGGEPVIDVQTHFLEYPAGSEASFGLGFPQARCGEEDPAGCFGIDNWITEVFGRSDTTVAVLSAVPVLGEPDPLSAELMAQARDRLAELCGEGRVLVQGHGVPNVGDLGAALAAMEDEAARYPLVAWKAYTHAGPGWRLDDADPAGRQVGEAFLSKVDELGVDVVCVHKGLSGGEPVRLAGRRRPGRRRRPTCGSASTTRGFESGVTEGPYDPAAPNGAPTGWWPAWRRPGSVPAPTCTPSWAPPGAPSCPRPTRRPTCWASCWWRWGRTGCCGAPTRSGTARPRTRSTPSGRSGSARAPGGARLPGAHRRGEGQDPVAQRRRPPRPRPGRPAVPDRPGRGPGRPPVLAARQPHLRPRTWAAARRLFAAEHPWA